ncbi:MAG: tetratricopeptide repeat protein [Bacteroidota bacterium]
MQKIILSVLLLLQSISLFAKGYFEYTSDATAAYHKVIDLRFVEAQRLIDQVKKETPENLVVHHLENYIDFLKAYINENEVLFDQAEARKNRRLKLVEAGDKNSPYYLYLQANIRMQWAVARIKFEQWYGAFRDINQAFKLLEKNVEKYPDFMPNKKDLGFLHAIVSSLPSGVEWISSLEGDYKRGKRELKEVLRYASKNNFMFERETYILYAYVLLQFGKEEQGAWRAINASSLNPKTSPTAAFILANVAMKSGHNDEAISLLEERPKSTIFYPFPYLDYMLGLAKLHRLDEDADQYFKHYLNHFKGRNYIKQSYRLLAWHELVQGRTAGYRSYIKEVKRVGHTYIGADESAQEEAEEGILPNASILKARLLFDGAYYQRAYEILHPLSGQTFDYLKTNLEYDYFLGRTTHQLKRYDEALKHYQEVIQKGRYQDWYYACRAALESGRIYRIKKDYKQAENTFQLCLDIHPKEHAYSLHRQAKIELNRLRTRN